MDVGNNEWMLRFHCGSCSISRLEKKATSSFHQLFLAVKHYNLCSVTNLYQIKVMNGIITLPLPIRFKGNSCKRWFQNKRRGINMKYTDHPPFSKLSMGFKDNHPHL